MELLIPGAVLAAGLAMLVRVVQFYLRGDVPRGVFWLLLILTGIELVRLPR